MARLNFIVRGGADFSSINNSIKQTQARLSGFQNSTSKSMSFIGTAIKSALAYVGVRALFNFGKSAVEVASNLVEVQNVVDVTFGSMAGSVNDFAENSIEAFGLSELSAKKYTAYLGAMLKSSGITGEAVKDMSLSLTEHVADMASFYDLPYDEMFDKLMGGMAGAVKPLRVLGVNMTIANMESYALSQGITKSWKAMSQAEKTMLRYNYLMNATNDSSGDFVRTQHTWANQIKILQQKWKAFSAELGQGLINILIHVVRGLNKVIEGFVVAGRYFREFTALIFGSADVKSKGVVIDNEGIAEGAEGMNDFEESAKEAKKTLMGFDEINQLDSITEDTGNIGDAFGDIPVADVGEPIAVNIDTTKLEKLQELLQPIIEAFGNLKEAIKPFAANVGEGLKWFWDNVLVPFGTWVMNEAIPAFINGLAKAIGFANTVLEVFKPFGIWLWESFLLPIAKWTGGVIVGVIDGLVTALGKISEWISKNKDKIITMSGSIELWERTWKNLKDTVLVVYGIIKNVIDIFTRKITKFKEDNSEELAEFAENVSAIWKGLGIILSGIWKIVLTALQTIWDNIGKPLFEGVGNWISEVLGGLLKFINGVFAGDWEKAIKGLVQIFGSTFNAIVELCRVPVNLVIGVINGLIEQINLLMKSKIGQWALGMLGVDKDFQIGLIGHIKNPLDDKGALPIKPGAPPTVTQSNLLTNAIGNQNGLTNFLNLADPIASAVGTSVMSAIQFVQSDERKGTNTEVNINIDGNKLAKVMLPKLNKETERLGLKTILQTN